MSDADDNTRSEFARRLEAAQGRRAADRDGNAARVARNTGSFGLGFRIAVELMAGVAVGVGIGLGLDRWLGTSPWLLLLFLVIGSAAGMLNVLRAVKANETAQAQIARERAAERATADDRNERA